MIDMGFRYRKSINLGGGFKINLSKSGVGYSWGTKGFLVTNTARGTTRRTVSILGTGISYVDETGGKKRRKNNRRNNAGPRQTSQPERRQSHEADYSTVSERAIQSADIDQFKESEEGNISAALERTMRLNWIGTLLIIGILLAFYKPVFALLPIAGIVLKVMAHTAGRVDLEYSFDAEKEDEHNRRIGAW